MPFLIALALGLLLTPLFGGVGRLAGLVDRPTGDGLKIHTEPRPLTGGLAIVTATLVATAVAGEELEPLEMAAVLLLLVVGVADDALSLPPLARLVVQLAAGGAFAAAGLTISPLGGVGAAVVVLAVPAVANAVNIVDGQDALAGGLTAVAALGITSIRLAEGDPGALGPALVASILAFLMWNRPPARIFLGDGGAYAVGGVLVLLVASTARTWEALLGVVLCMGILALELGSTMIRRVAAREPLVSGDRSHAYDLLADRLSSRDRATAVVVAAGVVLAALGVLVSRLPLPAGLAVFAGTAVGAVIAVLVLWRWHGALRHSR